MARPKMTRSGVGGDAHPRCPHCDASMWDAPTTLSKVMIGYPHAGFIHVDADGYAYAGDYWEVDCSSCRKPSAVAFERGNWVKLIAARTHTDEAYKEAMAHA